MRETPSDERLANIGNLQTEVRMFLQAADDQLKPAERPNPLSHGVAVLSRWRFQRLRRALGE